MKKQCWVNILIIIFSLLAFVGCTTLPDQSQITNATIDLAEAKLSQGQLKQAIDVYTNALQKVENEKLYYNKLLLLIEDKNYEEADILATIAFQKYPTFLKFLKARIQIYLEQKEYDKALEIADQILNISPFDDDAITTILQIFKEEDKNQELFNRAKSFYEMGYINNEILTILSQNDSSYEGIKTYYLEKENSDNTSDTNPD